MDAVANFAYSTIATAPSPATSGTTASVAAGTGSRFPAVPFNAVIWPVGQIPIPSNAEIVRVTARSTDSITFTRTQESTSARTVIVGDQIAAAITAKTLTDLAAGWTVISPTDTGAQNNYAPTGLSGNTLIEWNGASDIAITGLAGGVAGQLVRFKNVTAAKLMTFANLSGSSSSGNQFKNFVSSGLTPVFTNGEITFQHDGTNWKIVSHEQGAWINVAYSAGDFTAAGAMTWTVDSGDLQTFRYKLDGTTLHIDFVAEATTIGGTPDGYLQVKVPGGFTPTGSVNTGQATEVYMFRSNGGAYTFDGAWNVGNGSTNIRLYRGGFGGGTWPNGTNNNGHYLSMRMQVN